MKKAALFLPLSVLLCAPAAPAIAQENYNLPASAQTVIDLTKIVGAYNARVFDRAGLPIGSTQASVCTALLVAGGSGCTNAQARAAKVRIYPQTLAGREEYVQFEIAQPDFISQLAAVPAANIAARCAVFAAKNQAGKDAELTEIGQPTGGVSCPYR